MADNQLRSFLRKSLWGIAGLSIARGLFRTGSAFLWVVVVAALADWFLELASPVRRGLWWCGLVVLVGFFASGFFPLARFSLRERSRRLRERLGHRWREDELTLVRDLLAQPLLEGQSPVLKEVYLESAAQRLKEVSPFWADGRFPWKKWCVLFGAGLAAAGLSWSFFPNPLRVGSRILFPFQSWDMSTALRVHPGDAEVPWGGEAKIQVALLVPSLDQPRLQVRSGKGWTRVDAVSRLEQNFTFVLEHVVQPVSYRVEWRGDIGRSYVLTPVKPISVTEFNTVVTPPSYTGEAALTQSEPALQVLPGSRIQMKVRVSEPVDDLRLRLSLEDRRPAKKLGASSFEIEFIAEKVADYGFDAKVKGEWRDLNDVYPLRLLEDQPPTISLLSPDQDLVVAEKEDIPLTFEATDDVGLGRVMLEWERQNTPGGSAVLKSFEGSQKTILSTHEWSLINLNMRSGELARYRLIAFDRNTVTGPGKAATPWRTIEIRSFEKAHDDLEKELEAWRDKALDALAKTTTLQSKIDKSQSSIASQSPQAQQLAEELSRLEKSLERIVSHMEADPLADYGVWLEHRSMEENLSAMNQMQMPATKSAIEANQKERASRQLEEMAAELERMTALSEELSKEQKARDVVQAGSDLANAGDDLNKLLSEAGEKGLSEADRRKIEKLLADAAKALSDIAEALQKMPEELPDDFVNQEALEKLDLGASQSLLEQIQAAMRAGDMSKAMRLAQQFKEMAESLRGQLSKAHESFESGRSAEQLSKKISEEQKKLDELVQSQVDLLSKTQQLDAKRWEELSRRQADRLKALEARQREVLRRAGAFLADEKAGNDLRAALQGQLPAMNIVLNEFAEKKVEKSPVLLTGIVSVLSAAAVHASSVGARGSVEVKDISTEEALILEELNKPLSEEGVFKSEDKKAFQDLSGKQNDLRTQASELRKRVQKLSRETASLGVSLSQALKNAGEAMGQASDSLEKGESGSAYRFEEEALRHLMDGQSMMEQAGGQASEMAQQQGGDGPGGRGSVRVLGRTRGGQSGVQTAPVRLPRAEDYRPPAAFREELLKALKEKYPKVYEDVIHKYYRRLTE